jgi:type II secretory ATPase GspE/PulE/Tfp pilus assembly ATPase PilB-like protein
VVAALRGRPDFAHTVRVLRAQGVLGSADDPLTGIRFYRGRGCRQCNHTGFRGRIGVFELFETDDQIRRMIMERQDVGTVRTEAIARGMRTMFEDGLAKALLGDTTLEEVYRVAP